MGQFHFDVPSSAVAWIESARWANAHINGIEGVPFACHTKLTPSGEGRRLTIGRGVETSGKLVIPILIDPIGIRTLTSCSLRPLDDEPYLLPLELARGSCCQARTQSDLWSRAGLSIGDPFYRLLEQGTQLFLAAAGRHGDPNASAEAAIESIRLLQTAIDQLGDAFAMQSIAFRKQRDPQIGTLLAASVVPPAPVSDHADRSDHADAYRETFNAVAIRMSWADVETDSGNLNYDSIEQSLQFAIRSGLRVIAGPLIDFRNQLMPHWLYLLEDDFEQLLAAVVGYVERTVTKFRGRVHLWNGATGLNTAGPLRLDDEQAMRLSLGVVEAIRRCDPQTPSILSFDMPLGEYLAKDREGISPLHFADAVARSGLGVAGIGLDVRMGYDGVATLPRSAIDLGLAIDRWATLNLPLMVQLTVPGGIGIDKLAIAPADVIRYEQRVASPAAEQLRIAGPLVRMMLAKHVVHAIVWDGWADDVPHVSSHSGLIDPSGRPRPLMKYLQRLSREFLVHPGR